MTDTGIITGQRLTDEGVEYFDKPVQTDSNNWYEHLVTDCKAIIVERLYRSRMEVIEGWHEVGQRIVNDPHYTKYAKGSTLIHRKLAHDLGKSLRALYFAMKFYEKYPDLDGALGQFVEGKNISWTKITSLYLYDGQEEPPEDESAEIDLEPYHVLFRSLQSACNSTRGVRPLWLDNMEEALKLMEDDPREGVSAMVAALRRLAGSLQSLLYRRSE